MDYLWTRELRSTKARRSDGAKNSLYISIKKAQQEEQRRYRELRHTVRRLTRKEIAAQYPPERVAALLKQAEANRKVSYLPPDVPGLQGLSLEEPQW